MEQFTTYCLKAMSGAKPIIGCAIGALNYILFPDDAFLTAAMAVGIAMLLDIVTKYVALSTKAGGFLKAIKKHEIRSDSLWHGTRIKLFSYLTVAILAGLSYRVVQLETVSIFFATVVYSILFLREAQSILENLCDSGADMKWMLVWTKRKQAQVLETTDTEIEDEKKEG